MLWQPLQQEKLFSESYCLGSMHSLRITTKDIYDGNGSFHFSLHVIRDIPLWIHFPWVISILLFEKKSRLDIEKRKKETNGVRGYCRYGTVIGKGALQGKGDILIPLS